MSICPVALGYNWKGQAAHSKDFETGGAIYANVIKVADYVPLLSVISGIFKIGLGIYLLTGWKTFDTHEKCDALLFTARGIVATLQLGLLLLPLDAIMTIVNGILSHKHNQRYVSV